MKRPAITKNRVLVTLSSVACFSLLMPSTVSFANAANPYSGIVERNSFGLKPPVNPADLIKPPPPVVADIKLQGITTILGRKQVLMKVKIPARPPEPAKDQSFVFVEGQREGEVEVKEIDPVEGTVRVDNGGTILALNMKEHGEKPTPGASVPAVGSPPVNNLPGALPPPANSAVPAAAVSPTGNIEGFGGNKTLPQRNIRTGTAEGLTGTSLGVSGNANVNTGADALAAQHAVAKQRTAEENVILYEANRVRREQTGNSFIKLPPHPALKRAQE